MAFQSTIYIEQPFGVIGELIQAGPQRADVLTMDSSGGTIGRVFTKSNSTNVATQGGTIGAGVVLAGVLANPKVYALRGTPNPLDPSLVLPGNSQGEFLTMGCIVVATTAAANIGDLVQYNTTTGVISTYAPGGSPSAGNATLPNAVVWNYPTAAAGLIAIRLTN